MLNNLKDEGILDIKDLEIKVTKSLIQFSENVNKVLKDNNLIYSDETNSKNIIEIIVREVLNLQKIYLSNCNVNQ